MLKFFEFIVYPIREKPATHLLVQSDTRIGRINLATGEVRMSQAHAGGATMMRLVTDKAVIDTLTLDELTLLTDGVRSTGGSAVGSSVMVTDNSGALTVGATPQAIVA